MYVVLRILELIFKLILEHVFGLILELISELILFFNFVPILINLALFFFH